MKKSMKTRKLFVSLILTAAVAMSCGCVFGLTACAKPDIGVCLTNTSDALNVAIGDAVKDIFEPEGLKVSVQSADSNVTNQINQINAFVTQGVQEIVVCPTEVNALADVLNNARSKGIKVVISGANTSLDCYDALSASDEFLVGCYTALLAKHWIDEKVDEGTLTPGEFDICIGNSTLQEDAYKRSLGLATIVEPYLIRYEMEVDSSTGLETDNLAADSNGDFIPYYCDAEGNRVDEDHLVENPAYCPYVDGTGLKLDRKGNTTKSKNVWWKEMTLEITSGGDYMGQALQSDDSTRVFLCYASLFAPTMSQYVVDADRWINEEFGIFSGGVSGSEPAYILGSIPSAVEEKATVEYSGKSYNAVESVFRGAAAFGGTDAAQAVADLAYNVLFGVEGVDYEKRTAESIGIWYSIIDDDEVPDTLAILGTKRPEKAQILDFDPVESLSADTIDIKWQRK